MVAVAVAVSPSKLVSTHVSSVYTHSPGNKSTKITSPLIWPIGPDPESELAPTSENEAVAVEIYSVFSRLDTTSPIVNVHVIKLLGLKFTALQFTFIVFLPSAAFPATLYITAF